MMASPPPRIEYTGPLGRSRMLKLDLADDELVENTTRSLSRATTTPSTSATPMSSRCSPRLYGSIVSV
jgi:hypothetical protein